LLAAVLSAAGLFARVDQPSRFAVLSARGTVGAGEDVLIGGFVISGSLPKQVLVRASGPALQAYGVAGHLEAVNVAIYAGSKQIASNQGGVPASNAADIAIAGAKVGAFPIPAGSADAAFLATLEPGIYTAIASSPDSSKGVALLEVYEVPISSGALLTTAVQQQIQDVVDKAMTDYEIPGILYSIKFPGEEPWSRARGVRDVTTNEALMPGDHFRIGSASKTFTGAAVLKAIEEGRMQFETTIDQLLPDDVLSNYPRDQITVRMLLDHTSGINSYTNFIDDWFMPYITDRTRVWTDEELVALVNSKFSDPELGQIATPGAVWYYSNTNTVVLGMILERLYGKSIREIIEGQFITPLGLADTVYPAPGDSVLPEPYAHGYMNWANYVSEPSLPSTDLDVSVYDPSGVGAAGAIVSTVGDLARWIEALGTKPVGSPSMRRGHMDWKYFVGSSGTISGSGVSYGMCMAHEPDSTNGADYWIVGHRGQISGYDTAMMYLPEQETAIVVACTRSLKNAPGFPTNANTVALNAIVNILFPKLIADHKVEVSATPESAAQRPGRQLRSLRPTRRYLPLSEY
jgi:D-alanyl-D-alanine carboxypeptidase